MMANKPVLLALLVAAALVSVHCQVPPCFTVRNLNQTSINILAGDKHSIDLDAISKGTNLTFGFSTDKQKQGIMEGNLIEPFEFNKNPTLLDASYKKCSTFSQGRKENDYILICDKSNLLFLTFEPTNGTVIKQQAVALDSDMTCHTVQVSTGSGKAYVICTTPDNSLGVYSVDSVDPAKTEPLRLEQKNQGEILATNLKMMIDEYTYDGKVDTIIYVWEDSQTNNKVRFRLFKDNGAQLLHGGFFSTSNKSSKGIKDGMLVGFYYLGSKVYILTRDAGNDNYIQKCLRSPYYSTYICDPDSALKLENGVARISITQLDQNSNTNKLLEVVSVLTDKVYVSVLSPGEWTYVRGTAPHSIKGHHLKQITQVVRSNNNFFFTGPLGDDPSTVNGVIKYKVKSQSFEEYDYSEYNPTIMILRRDYFNIHYTDLYTIGTDRNSKLVAAFYIIKKHMFIVSTRGWIDKPEAREVKYTLTCQSVEGWKSELSFTFKTTLQVNDNIKFSVPESLYAYTGAKSIWVPTNGEDISGNAGDITNLKATAGLEDLDLDTLMINQADKVNYKGTRLSTVTGLRHIGESNFAVYNDDKLVIFGCSAGGQANTFDCEENEMDIDISANHQVFVKAQVLNGIMISVTSHKKVAGAPEQANTTIRAKRLEDGQNLFEPIHIPHYTQLAEVKFVNSKAVIITVGGSNYETPRGIYYLSFELVTPKLPTKFAKIRDLEAHICPTELSWAPRQKQVLYIASVCNPNASDNHVYPMVMDFNNLPDSEIVEALQVMGAKEFRLCAQEDLVNVINIEGHDIYSFDTNSNQETHIRLPLNVYGVDTLVRHTCDQENGILQVIACRSNEYKDCKLITYRANLRSEPNRRVHSLIDLPAQAGVAANKKYSRLASSSNDSDDDTLTVVISDDMKEINIFRLGIDGPHIKLHPYSTKVPEAKTYTLDWTITYPGPTAVTIPGVTNLTLIDQPTEVTLVPIDSKNLPVFQSDVKLDLEALAVVKGPFHSVDTSNGKSIIIDRLTKSNLHSKLTTMDFEDALVHQDFIFGYKLVGQSLNLVIYNADEPKEDKQFRTYDLKDWRVTGLQFVRKDGKIPCFFAILHKPLKKDQIWWTCTSDAGKTWTENNLQEMDTNGYKQLYIIDGPGKGYYLGGYNNQQEYTVSAFYFELDYTNKKLTMGGAPFTRTFRDNIADFEVVKVSEEYLVMIVGVMYTKKASFDLLRFASGTLSPKVSTTASLVPNAQETHQNIAFKCMTRAEDTINAILCVHTGKNLFSYVSRFELDLETTEPENLIKSQTIQTKLNNIVNLKPQRVDMKGNFISVTVKNENPLKAEEAQNKGAYFTDNYLILVYNFESKVITKEDETPERDVYRIISSVDLGIKSTADESKLDPRFFINSQGVMQLGINVAVEDKSIRVFNIERLSIVIPKSEASNGDYPLVFRGLKNEAITVPLRNIFKFSNPKPDDGKKNDNPKKGGSKMLLLIVICAVLLVIVIVVVGLIMTRKQGQSAEDLNIDDVEKTMKNPDESASGNYSKL